MFEKETEEYTGKVHRYKDNLKEPIQDEDVFDAFKDGAEFGYNKGKNEAKEIIKLLLWDLRNRSYEPVKDVERAEQFLKDCDIDDAIQQANKGLDFNKIADEMEQDLKDSEVEQ